jgi:hypothetical protein
MPDKAAGSDPIEDGLADGRECLEAALRYRARGWSVLALCPPSHIGIDRASKGHSKTCGSPGKAPWHHWKEHQDRAATEQEIRGWWARLPNSNLGLALGPVSGLIRVDVEGATGEAELLRCSGGDVPATLQFTSGKGRGLLYGIPPGIELCTTAKPLAVGEELRLQGKGAQTVLPPSRHKSGRRYEWVEGRGPDDIDPAPAPGWIIDLMRADRPHQRNGKALPLAEGEIIPEGKRDDTLTSMAGTMRRGGFSKEAIEAALLVENSQRCEPPLPDQQVAKIARSIGNKPAGPTPPLPRPDRQPDTPDQAPPVEAVQIGDLTLVPVRAHRTRSKLTVTVDVRRGGRSVDELSLSSAHTTKREVAVDLQHLLGDSVGRADIVAALGRLLVLGHELEDRPGAETVREIVRRRLADRLSLPFRTLAGLWSETEGRDLDRAAFLAQTPSWLLDEARSGSDAPEGAEDLLRFLRDQLGVAFADLRGSLPAERDAADVGPDSRRAEQFRQAILAMFTRPAAGEIIRPSGTPLQARASLASKAVKLSREWDCGTCQGTLREGVWYELARPLLAWWRGTVGADGEVSEDLAFRVELATQIPLTLPGVSSQADLLALGTRYGAISGSFDLPQRGNARGAALAVLSAELTAAILAVPPEEDKEAACEE